MLASEEEAVTMGFLSGVWGLPVRSRFRHGARSATAQREPRLPMSSENPYASPMSDAPPVLAQPSDGGLWQRRGTLVVARGATFPDRCVKCNEPAAGRVLKRRLAWHPGWVYVLILAGLVVYVIVALIIQKKMTIRVGICARHHARRQGLIATGWLIMFGSAMIPVFLSSIPRINVGMFAGAGLVGVFGGLIFLALGAQFISTSRIDRNFAWIKNTGREFRRSLPEWPGD